MNKTEKALEMAAIKALTASYEGPERYRPIAHRPRHGLRYELRVRLGDGEAWTSKLYRWYASESARNEALVLLHRGQGLLGQQARAGRLRRLTSVSR